MCVHATPQLYYILTIDSIVWIGMDYASRPCDWLQIEWHIEL